MANLNEVNLIGNVGSDPEIKTLPNGKRVANFSIATTSKWKNDKGDQQEKTLWHNITAYNQLVDSVIVPYVKKGSSLYVKGYLNYRDWIDKETNKKMYATEIVIDNIQLLGKRSENSN